MSTIATPSTSPARAPGRSGRLMRWTLLDAAVSGPAGVALLAGAPLLDRILGIPAPALAGIGAFFLAYTATLLLLARAGAPATAVAVVAAGNLGWAALSAVVIVADPLTMTTAGRVVTAAQAAAVAGLAVLQIAAVRDVRRG